MKKITLLLFFVFLSGCSNIHEHQYTEANYQQPAICTICQKEAGFPLQADFRKYNIILNMEINNSYQLKTVCMDDKTIVTTANVEIVEYINDYQNENYPKNEDYQWKRLVLKLSFDDHNVVENGASINYLTTNYYNISQYVATYNYNADKSCYEFTVNYYGVDYPECMLKISATDIDWKNQNDSYLKQYILTFDFFIPTDFDGIVVGVRNAAIDDSGFSYFYEYYDSEQFLLFRLD
ncbi:MAG: hypothetical protein ACOX1F_04750 [Erysipelotrichaceae bacterium]|jgi:hypothetical protein